LVLLTLFSKRMQVSLLLWLSSRLATFSAFTESNSLFTRAVSLLRATTCFSFTILFPYTLFNYVPVIMCVSFCFASSCRPVCQVPWGAVLRLALAYRMKKRELLYLGVLYWWLVRWARAFYWCLWSDTLGICTLTSWSIRQPQMGSPCQRCVRLPWACRNFCLNETSAHRRRRIDWSLVFFGNGSFQVHRFECYVYLPQGPPHSVSCL